MLEGETWIYCHDCLYYCVCVSSSLLVLHVRGPGGDLGGRGVRAALRDHPRDGVAVPATRDTLHVT